jgi:YebC/PmpR family DNA-binding regulatory protein
MSGHSKWSTIKHKKEANDAKKGKAFSKVSTQITHAARKGGGDPDMNPSLRMYIEKAKSVGFPIDNIKKAIAKGTGESGDSITFEEASYEGFGPGGIAIIVDVLTDNKNRVVSELRNIFSDFGGSLGKVGSVSWNFETRGLITVRCGHMEKGEKHGDEDVFVKEDKEEVMMTIMDIEGILDIEEEDNDELSVFTEFQEMTRVRDEISKLGYVLKDAEIIKISKMDKELEGEDYDKAIRAIEILEDYNDVQNVWTDLVIK